MKLTKACVLLFFAVIVPPIFEFMPVTVRRGDEQTFTLENELSHDTPDG